MAFLADSFGERMMEALERALSPNDQRAEVMKMCLSSSTGDYEPVKMDDEMEFIPGATLADSRIHKSKPISNPGSVQVKPRVPGKAGGGWESSSNSDDDIADHQEGVQSSHTPSQSLK
jgi:hypothetical protein